MSGPSAKSEQAERRAIIKGDQALRPGDSSPSTMHAMSRLSNDLEGRQSARDYVVGEAETVSYPSIPAGPWSSGYAQLPPEEPLGYSVNDLLPTGEPHELARSLAELSATALISADAGRAEVAAPTLVDHPTANVVERASATSLISSASASPAGDGDGVGHNHSIVRNPVPNLIHRPARKL
jgi:hypothetical protein